MPTVPRYEEARKSMPYGICRCRAPCRSAVHAVHCCPQTCNDMRRYTLFIYGMPICLCRRARRGAAEICCRAHGAYVGTNTRAFYVAAYRAACRRAAWCCLRWKRVARGRRATGEKEEGGMVLASFPYVCFVRVTPFPPSHCLHGLGVHAGINVQALLGESVYAHWHARR